MEIFCCPCSNKVALAHFNKTIENEIELSSIENLNINKQIIDDIKNNVGDTFRVWGVKDASKLNKTWEKLSPGDIVFFYSKGKIICTSKFKYKLQNSIIANELWGIDISDNKSFDHLIFLDNIKFLDINSTKENGDKLIYESFSRVNSNKDRILYLINENDKKPVVLSLDSILEKSLNINNQVVLTGAPGTGKTFGALKYVESMSNKNKDFYEFVQFHPSYDYSDFVEGLRPVVLDNDQSEDPTFVRLDGIFKKFCRKIIMKDFLENNKIVDYNSFKETYKTLEEKDKLKNKYYFIIDEINRADLSKVFGELMFGLEKSYRGINHLIKTQYKNLQTYEILKNGKAKPLDFDCFKEGFFIPKNLYIIGTMNDIDKSVDSFDFALRRRFEWVDIKVKDIIEEQLTEMLIGASNDYIQDLVSKINAMNEVISTEGKMFGLSEAYHIGPAYFKKLNINDENSLESIFNSNIVSILKEYTRGRDKEYVDDFIEKCADALEVNYLR